MIDPEYLQVRNKLLQQVRDGTLQPGDRIPSANQLKQQHNTTRMMVMRAIRDLADDGVLRRTEESGTFVAHIPHQFPLTKVCNVVDEITRLGGEPRTVVSTHRRTPPPEDARVSLGIGLGEDVFRVCLLQSMDDKPAAYEECFATVDAYPDFLDQDFSSRGIFDYLGSRFVLDEIEDIVCAVCTSRGMAEYLEIDYLEPCIQVKRRYWHRGQCVALTRTTYAGTRHALGGRHRPDKVSSV